MKRRIDMLTGKFLEIETGDFHRMENALGISRLVVNRHFSRNYICFKCFVCKVTTALTERRTPFLLSPYSV